MLRKLLLPAVFLCLAASAFAQENYTDGPVWRVTYLTVKPGKMNAALMDLRQNFNKVQATAKAQGVILDYKVFLNTTNDGPTDWNIAIALLYKSYAGLDGLTAKMEAITAAHYGSADARQAATEKRVLLWDVVSSRLAREITLK